MAFISKTCNDLHDVGDHRNSPKYSQNGPIKGEDSEARSNSFPFLWVSPIQRAEMAQSGILSGTIASKTHWRWGTVPNSSNWCFKDVLNHACYRIFCGRTSP